MTAPARRDALRALGAAVAMGAASLAARQLTPRRLLADTPGRQPFAQWVPRAFAAWHEADDVRLVPPTPDVQTALARVYDDTLARAYRRDGGGGRSVDGAGSLVMLSLCHAHEQRGQTVLHRPERCYAGQGFAIAQRDDAAVVALAGRRIAVTRLLTQGPRAEPVTYWLVVGTRVVRFGLDWHLATLVYGLGGAIADGLLVRVSSLDSDAARAFALHERFMRDLVGAVGPQAVNRLLGSA